MPKQFALSQENVSRINAMVRGADADDVAQLADIALWKRAESPIYRWQSAAINYDAFRAKIVNDSIRLHYRKKLEREQRALIGLDASAEQLPSRVASADNSQTTWNVLESAGDDAGLILRKIAGERGFTAAERQRLKRAIARLRQLATDGKLSR